MHDVPQAAPLQISPLDIDSLTELCLQDIPMPLYSHLSSRLCIPNCTSLTLRPGLADQPLGSRDHPFSLGSSEFIQQARRSLSAAESLFVVLWSGDERSIKGYDAQSAQVRNARQKSWLNGIIDIEWIHYLMRPSSPWKYSQ